MFRPSNVSLAVLSRIQMSQSFRPHLTYYFIFCYFRYSPPSFISSFLLTLFLLWNLILDGIIISTATPYEYIKPLSYLRFLGEFSAYNSHLRWFNSTYPVAYLASCASPHLHPVHCRDAIPSHRSHRTQRFLHATAFGHASGNTTLCS
jgi:hypothetical protein